MEIFNQWEYNNFNSSYQGKDGHNFGSTHHGRYHGRGRGNYNQDKTNYSYFHYAKYGHKVVDCTYQEHANIV